MRNRFTCRLMSVQLVWIGILAMTVNSVSLPALADSPRDPITTNDQHLCLFVDDHWISEQHGIQRVTNRAKPLAKPIIWPDAPDTETDCAWGNVIRESDGRFRLWYCTMMMGDGGKGAHQMAKAEVWGRGTDYSFRPRSPADVRDVESMLGKYAESSDGLLWHKPKLNLIEFRNSRENNIVLNGERAAKQTMGALTNFDGYSILRDDNEANPERRYKMVSHWESVHCWDNHAISGSLGRPQEQIDRYWAARGEYITYSPDGLRWDQPLERVDTLPSGGGDRLVVVPDPRHQRWMAYVRASGLSYPSFSHSVDLIHWSAALPARQITPKDVQSPAVECMIPFNYGNQDIGFPCGMDKPKGVFTVMLASRQEESDWTWVENHQPLIPYGPPGSYYATGAVPLHNEPFIVGDELLIFFNAFSRHQQTPCPYGTRSIGVATMRRDGFAGITATDGNHATVTTKPIVVSDNVLFLNVERPGETGRIEVALLNEEGEPLPGFGFADSVPIEADQVRAQVKWKTSADLSTLKSRSIRISLRIQGNAILYAITFGRVDRG